jgi:hypothetical protein
VQTQRSAKDAAIKEAKMINPNAERTRRSAAIKLSPCTFRTTTVVRSLLAYLLNERWTDPHLIDVRCGDDGMLVGFESDSDDYLRLLVRRDDLVRAVLVLTHLAALRPSERTYLLDRVPLPSDSQ